MKKSFLIGIGMSLCLFSGVTALADNSERIKEIESQIASLQLELDALKAEDNAVNGDATVQESEVTGEGITVLGDYTLADDIGWYTRHFFILQNNTGADANIKTSSMAYDAEGNIVAFDDSEIDVLSAGGTAIVYEALETGEAIDHYDTTIDYKEPKYYESVDQDLEYKVSDIGKGLVVQITNNGADAARFVEGIALFFQNGDIVDYGSTYFTDDDSEIKPDSTINKQISTFKEYDSYEFYAVGKKNK